MRCRPNLVRSLTVAAGFSLLTAPVRAQLVFNLNDGADLTALSVSDNALYNQVRAGFQSAASRWSTRFTDAVTINLTINYAPLPLNKIGEAGSAYAPLSYAQLRSALAADALSADDALATASLPNTSSIDLFLNRTANSPNGPGSATPYLDNDGDANNASALLTRANAKALGLLGASDAAEDAHITFSSAFPFDFAPGDGVTGGTIDFIGIATHEIGHALGFFSGMDILDQNSTGTFYQDDEFTFLSSLDLFRFSADSTAAGVRDWTADNRPKYFSLDGGTTNLGLFSTGLVFGDGWQGSHWKDNLGMGIMDPSAAYGEPLHISRRDLRALDVIGWNLATAPEPASWALLGLGLVAVASLRRRTELQ